MTTDILLVTPLPEFGDTIRRIVDDSEIYKIHVVNDKSRALLRAVEMKVSLVLLDLALGEEGVLALGAALRKQIKEIQLAVLCGNETPPSLDAIRPWSLVRIPQNIEDLIHAFPTGVEHQSETRLTPMADNSYNENMSTSDSPSWMGDVTKAAAHLARLTLGSAAQAALITRKGEVWAYAGSLSQEAAREIAATVKRRGDDQKSADLVCFIRLESTRAEHMLYATRLDEESELALVFESETPFSTIRAQASDLLTHLEEESKGRDFETGSGEARGMAPSHPTGELRSAFEFSEDEDAQESGIDLPPISEILTNVPSPDPSVSQPVEGGLGQGIQWPRRDQKQDAGAAETRAASPLSDAQVFNLEGKPDKSTTNSRVKPTPISSQPQGSGKSSEFDVTRLSPTTDASRKISLEPVTAGLYHLVYACLFVPRFAHHYLSGDLADKLAEWLPNVCVSFGWRLESLAVRPEYLQWVVNVQPNTSPGFVMRMMRQHTNEKIFQTFGRIKKENPSGDFWAPGYLIMGGSNPHPPQLVRDYIKQIRIRQGLEANR
jgi:REP element-mobilizing transposase RayT/ActR/RegA family two-component response regulator